MDGNFEKLHLSMAFPALLCGIYGLSVWMQIKWMGKINNLMLKTAFGFIEGTSQRSPEAAGGEFQAAGLAQPWMRESREDPAAPGSTWSLSAPAPSLQLPKFKFLVNGHRCHMNFYIYLKPCSEKLPSF